jgi:hypothetical protein
MGLGEEGARPARLDFHWCSGLDAASYERTDDRNWASSRPERVRQRGNVVRALDKLRTCVFAEQVGLAAG